MVTATFSMAPSFGRTGPRRMLLPALRSAKSQRNRCANGSPDQDAVRAGDLPHVAVGIGERAGVGI